VEAYPCRGGIGLRVYKSRDGLMLDSARTFFPLPCFTVALEMLFFGIVPPNGPIGIEYLNHRHEVEFFLAHSVRANENTRNRAIFFMERGKDVTVDKLIAQKRRFSS
jgi:hypothetical protein